MNLRQFMKRTKVGHLIWRIFIGILGGLVTVLGAIALVGPGPGVLVVLAGLGILATEFAWASRAMAHTKNLAQKAAGRAGLPLWVKYLLIAATSVFSILAIIFYLHKQFVLLFQYAFLAQLIQDRVMSAITATPIHPVLTNRRSPRSFDANATISNEDLLAILEAARWAPSANNFQPWRFHVGVRGDDVFESVLNTLVPFNQSWANRASALILVSIVNQNEDGTPRPISGFDAGLAVSQLTFEAHSRGQVVHQMAGFDAAKAAETFGLSSDLTPIVVIAIGVQGPAEQLEGVLLEREKAPRQRKDLDEIVLAGIPSS